MNLGNINVDVLNDPYIEPPQYTFNQQHIQEMSNDQRFFVEEKNPQQAITAEPSQPIESKPIEKPLEQ